MIRVGMGYDVHAFEAGDHIVIGGVRIPHDQGLRAHSDGDVLLHALCDALLGALALGDIGQHFPDSDERWRNANSRELLTSVVDMITEAGYQMVNLDAVLVAERPKFSPYIQSMRDCIAEDMGVAIAQISIKATTTEKLGFIGRGEGIAAQVVVLLESTASQ